MACLKIKICRMQGGKEWESKKRALGAFSPNLCFRNETTQSIPLRYLIGRIFRVQQHSLTIKILKLSFLKIASFFFILLKLCMINTYHGSNMTIKSRIEMYIAHSKFFVHAHDCLAFQVCLIVPVLLFQ